MSIFVNADTKVIVQGLTGGQGRFYGLRNRAYGTQVVGGREPEEGRHRRRGHPGVRVGGRSGGRDRRDRDDGDRPRGRAPRAR